jgi:hypothetical protein
MGRRRTVAAATPQQVALYEAHASVVGYWVARFGRWRARAAGLELDDLRQAARLGLWRACLNYEAERGLKFHTLAGWSISWAMHDCVEAARYGRKRRGQDLLDHSAFAWLDPDDRSLAQPHHDLDLDGPDQGDS